MSNATPTRNISDSTVATEATVTTATRETSEASDNVPTPTADMLEPKVRKSAVNISPAKSSEVTSTKATTKAAPKPAAKATSTVMKNPAAKAPASFTKKPPEVSVKPVKDAKEKKVSPKKQKLLRDSFTFPENDYALIRELKQRVLTAGRDIKKSELLRAGLAALDKMTEAQLVKAVDGVERIKTGRPTK